MTIKIVKVIGGRMDGKEVHSDCLAPDDEQFLNAQLLLIDDDVPLGKRFGFKPCDGQPRIFLYEVGSNSFEGATRTIVLRSAGQLSPTKK